MEEYVLKLMENGLSVSYSELYSLTLPEIAAAVRGLNSRIRREKIMFGTLTAAIYNTAIGKKRSHALKWSDIYPDDESHHQNTMSGEQFSAKLHAMFGGVA